MAARSYLIVLLLLLMLPGTVTAQTKYTATYLTPKKAYVDSAVVSVTGSTIAARVKTTLRVVTVATRATKNISLDALGGNRFTPLAINDTSSVLGVRFIPSDSGQGGTCSVLSLNTDSSVPTELFSFPVTLLNACTSNDGGPGIVGAINDAGEVFTAYRLRTQDDDKTIFSFIDPNGKVDVHEDTNAQEVPDAIQISSKGEGVSAVPFSDSTNLQLIFYNDKDGLTLFDVPASLQKAFLTDIAGSKYLFLSNNGEQTIIYSLPNTRAKGSSTELANSAFKDSFPASKKRFRSVKTFVSVDKVNASSQLAGRVTTADNRIRSALLDAAGSTLILANTKRIRKKRKKRMQVNDLEALNDAGQIFGYLQNRTASRRALVVFTPVP